ncbi:MAG: hypothetical protein P8M80_08870 [Pirellulaceae bacterium]|nr:hypothetical protein [Pirellulaceae bacterium]
MVLQSIGKIGTPPNTEILAVFACEITSLGCSLVARLSDFLGCLWRSWLFALKRSHQVGLTAIIESKPMMGG